MAGSFITSAKTWLGEVVKCVPRAGAAVDAMGKPCSCPAHEKVPPQPVSLPCKSCEGNVNAMKKWLLNCYTASTFKKCARHLLLELEGPELEIATQKQYRHTP